MKNLSLHAESRPVSIFFYIGAFCLQTLSIVVDAQPQHPPAPAPPLAPSDFQATAGPGYQIQLSWTDNSDDETGFILELERNDGECCFEHYELPENTTTFTHTVVPNVLYNYYLWAENIEGSSDLVETTGIITVQAPPVPENVFATDGSYSVTLTFTDNSDLETAYEVQYTLTPELENYTSQLVPGTGLGNMVTFILSSGLLSDTRVYFRVRGIINDNGTIIPGPFSPIVSATTFPLPAVPSDFVATPDADRVHLSWTDNSFNEIGFRINRYVGENREDNWEDSFTVPPNTTTFTDTTLNPNVDYTYQLEALDVFPQTTGLYVYASATLIVPPAAPTEVSAVALDQNTFQVSYRDNSMFESGYNLLYSTSPDGPFTEEQFGGGSPTSGTINVNELSGFEPGTTYYLMVRAFDIVDPSGGVVSGALSEMISATTPPDPSLPEAPQAKPATFVKQKSFIANWEAVANATHYELDVFKLGSYQFLPGYEGKIVQGTSQLVTGTKKNKRYAYVVRAVNEFGESENSDTIIVAPVKSLALYAACSDNPAVNRRWKIINPNPFPVAVSWKIHNTSQAGTLDAAPGVSFFTAQTISGPNIAVIRWYDDKLVQHIRTRYSTGKDCDHHQATSIARENNDDEMVESSVSLFRVSAYPNPTVNKFRLLITAPSDNEVEVEIVDLFGHRLHSTTAAGSTEKEINVSHYPSGIYILKARQGMSCHTLKLLKQ